jgi:acyl carrier protein
MDYLLTEVNSVFKKVFGRDDLQVNEQTTADDVTGWDSLTHMALITAIEEHFKLIFSFDEVREFRNVGDLIKLIRLKKGK